MNDRGPQLLGAEYSTYTKHLRKVTNRTYLFWYEQFEVTLCFQ